MRLLIILVATLLVAERTVDAGPWRRYRQTSRVATVSRTTPVQGQEARPALPPESTAARQEVASAIQGVDDALEEVNAARAKRGLRPFVPDPLLNQAARACARLRATNRIEGHLASDFAYLPSGATATSAGCGALEPSWGWGTCCTYDNYTYAGAAWVMGADGRRYMHLFVR